MISIYFECAPEEQELLGAELYAQGTLGILELPGGLRAWFADREAAAELIERYDGAVLEEPLGDEDWVRRTEESFPALPIGEKFWLAPPWNNEPVPDGRLRLEITPGMACGTGWHECTQMCLEYLERFVKPGSTVLDVGSGSGILSVAAKLLGAGLVVSCDVDEEAVAVGRAGTPLSLVGSADAVASGRFDVVVANISAAVVRDMEGEFRRVCAADGVIVVSGFGEWPLERGPRESVQRGEWAAGVV